MGFLFNRGSKPQSERAYWGINSPADLIPRRIGTSGNYYIDPRIAMQNSAVWAAIRLRADLISTLPVDVYRIFDGVQIEAPGTALVNSPGFMEFLYSSQVELDRSGNAVGIIRSTDGAGYPADILLKPTSCVDVIVQDDEIVNYKIDGLDYSPSVIWHEKQYTVPGCHVGLSPVAYAAWTLGQYRSVQEFVTNWFTSGQGPRASLKNVNKQLTGKEALVVKEAWRASQSMGEPFVHGADWEYSLIQAEQASADWLEAQKLSTVDVARFFNVPADTIDAALAGGPNITYANIVQKNLQFLIMHLGPSIVRRENSLSQLMPRPRFIKLNSDALLRMDPQTRAQTIKIQVDSRVLAPSEARALDNRPPFTSAQIEEFDELGLNRRGTTPETTLQPEPASDAPISAGHGE
jgi:HK97 family phage portal protein